MDKYGLDTGEISWREYKNKFPKRITDQSVKAAFMWIWKKQDQRWRDARREMARGAASDKLRGDVLELSTGDRNDVLDALRVASGFYRMTNNRTQSKGMAILAQKFDAYFRCIDAETKNSEIPF